MGKINNNPMRILSLILSVGFILSACSNEVFFPGSQGNNLNRDGTTSENLEGSALHFSSTLYPTLAEYCSDCHSNINPRFAIPGSIKDSHDNLIAAEKVNFTTPRDSRIASRVFGGHNCWSNCEENGNEILAAIESWAALRGDESVLSGLVTAELTIPADLTDQDPTTPGVQFPTLTFDLEGIDPYIPAGTTMEIEVGQFETIGQDPKYLFSNPVLRSEVEIFVSSIGIYINQTRVTGSAWETIERVVSANPDDGENLSSTSTVIADFGYGGGAGPGSDTILLKFSILGEPLDQGNPDFLAFKQMISDRNCNDCHFQPIAINNPEYLGPGAVVPSFTNFVTEEDWLSAGAYGINPDGSQRYLIDPGLDFTRSGIYRVLRHDNDLSNPGNSFEEYIETILVHEDDDGDPDTPIENDDDDPTTPDTPVEVDVTIETLQMNGQRSGNAANIVRNFVQSLQQ